jgi:hypothetical protein
MSSNEPVATSFNSAPVVHVVTASPLSSSGVDKMSLPSAHMRKAVRGETCACLIPIDKGRSSRQKRKNARRDTKCIQDRISVRPYACSKKKVRRTCHRGEDQDKLNIRHPENQTARKLCIFCQHTRISHRFNLRAKGRILNIGGLTLSCVTAAAQLSTLPRGRSCGFPIGLSYCHVIGCSPGSTTPYNPPAL